jgi:hypothetical protein
MNLKSRKLMVAIVCYLTATIFVITGSSTFIEWADFIKWVIGLYFIGNVGEHFTNKMNKNDE